MIRVNETKLDESAIVSEIQYHTAENQDDAKHKACESLIISELVKQRAAVLGLAMNDASEQEAALSTLIDTEVDIPEASETDCQTYFDNNRQKFSTSPLVSGRHILLAVPADDAVARSEARDEAKSIISRLTGNLGEFPAMAKEYSRCPSAKTGGHLGQISKGQTVPEFERQLFQCTEGLVDAPIESRYGIHIVDIDHKEEGKPLPFEMVKQRIQDYLNEKVKRKAIAQYLAQLVSQADIQGYDMNVSESPLMQ